MGKTYKKLLFIFVGDSNSFSLEHRVFNLLSVFICFFAFVSLFLNLWLGLYATSVISVIVCLTQSSIFYLSRVKLKLNFAIISTGLMLYTLLGINYFINGGINGPTLVLSLATLYILATVVSRKNIWYWLALNICLIAVQFGVEYFYPQSIIIGYSNTFVYFNDMFITYVIVIFLITAGIFYTRRAYEIQRKNLEVKALALEKLNSEKNKLFSIVSHDLRAPIGTIKQYLDFLKQNNLDPEEKLIIENGLVKSVDEAYALLDNLLTWAKSQMGGTKVFEKNLTMKHTLNQVLGQAKIHAESKGVSIIEDIDDNIAVKADENMLNLVIRNLLFNAVKFSKPRGQITLKIFKQSNQVIFAVKDNGVGISDENQKRIFSLNVQTTVGTKKEKGTGLGLVLCKEYTQLQNGKIWFESELGTGSTFYVSLPAVGQ